MAFKGDYLRVLTPVTSDGISPVVENDRIKYREDHLPTSARKMLEAKNTKLPSGLRKKIELVSNTVRPNIQSSKKILSPVHELDTDDVDEENLELETDEGQFGYEPTLYAIIRDYKRCSEEEKTNSK